MKSLEFEKVSIAEVRSGLDQSHKKVEERKRAIERASQTSAVLRGNRTGFPPDVAKELHALRSHYADLHPHRDCGGFPPM